MKAKELLGHLEQACRDRGIKLIYDDLQTEGGFCRARDSYYVIINRRAAPETRVKLLSDALEKISKQLPEELVVESVPATLTQVRSAPADPARPEHWQLPA